MMYSCFDDKTGTYRYFQDSKQIPFNSDLPIPSLPPAVGGIGVPSIEAGRPLPYGTKYVGSGWLAQGMVVQCDGGSDALGDVASAASDASDWVQNGGWKWLVAGAAALVILTTITRD